MIKERLNKLDKFFRNIREHKLSSIFPSISLISILGYIYINLLIKTHLSHSEASEAVYFMLLPHS